MNSIQKLLAMSDAELLILAQNGESEAVYALMEHDKKDICKIIHSVLHDKMREGDAWQDVFLNLNAEFQKHAYKDDDNFKKWLHTIVYRTACKTQRREKYYVSDDVRLHAEPDSEDNEEELLIHTEEHEALLTAVNMLPPRRKMVFTMHIFEEKDYNEIGGKLGLSADTVRSIYAKALAQVKMLLALMGMI
jgi:RNA polymerase sigma-70 factor, ECF subfamily